MAISDDGERIAFTDPVGPQNPPFTRPRVLDRTSARMVSVVSDQPITVFRQLSLSADGNLLAFVSNAPLQPDHDTDSTDDVYRYRLADESLRLESVDGDSAPGSGARLSPRLSVDDTTPTFQAIGSG